MVETHIDISSVVGESAIDKETITSNDNSLIVTETANGVDLSVVHKTITSEDGSVDVTETANGVDLSVPLVDEYFNGLESATDKELLDHSYTNIAMKGTYKSVDDAIVALQNIDSQYYPRTGQAIQFTDTDGKLRVFRYYGNYKIERNGSGREWISSAYDEKNGKWCILKYTKVGDLTVATANADASLWTIREDILGSRERWFSLASGDGKLVALSGNSSQEYAVSEDGGESWQLYSNLPTAYWVRIVYGMGKWWFCHESGLYTTTDFSTFENLSSRVSSFTSLICDMGVGQHCTYFLLQDRKVYVYDEDTKTLSTKITLSTENKISQVVPTDGGDVVAFSSNLGFSTTTEYSARVLKWDGSSWTTLHQNTATTLCGMMISQDLSTIVEIHHTKLVLVDSSTKETLEIEPEKVKNFSNYAVYGNKLLVVNGQHKESDSGVGNYAFLLDMLTGKILNSEWSEIPILSSDKNTLLAANDGEFANVNLSGHLTYSEASKTLTTENSDRYEEYENYRLSDGSSSLFVTSELSAIAIGDVVYADEQCATQVGTVENVHHNPNNPNDVVVKTSEDSSVVYRFVGKQIDSLANSQAVVNLWERVRNYSSDTFYTKEQTYTKEQVNELVDVKISYKVVTELPETGESGIIYFVPPITRTTQNEYDEYMWIDNAFELIGTTKVDLSDYYTIEEVDNALQAEADERKAEDAKMLPLSGGTMEGNLNVTTNGHMATPYNVDSLGNNKWIKLFTITENATGEKSFFVFDCIGRRTDARVCKVSMECVNTATSENRLTVAQFSDLPEYAERNNPIFYFRVVDNTFEIWLWCETWGKISITNISENYLFRENHTVEWNGEVYSDTPENLTQGNYGIYAHGALEDGFGNRIDTTYAKKANVYTKTESDNLLSKKADVSSVQKRILEITDDNKATYIQSSNDGTNYGKETYLYLDNEYDLVIFNTSNNTSIRLNGIRPLGDLADFSQGYIVTLVGGDSVGDNVRLSEAGRSLGFKYSFANYLYVHHGGQSYAQSGQCLFYQFMHYNGTWFSKSY